MKMQNKVVIITGASSGIGEATVKRFLSEGAKVVGCGIESAMVVTDENAVYVQADLCKYENAQNVVAKAVETFGKVDCLVNCAGISIVQSLESATTESFEKEFAVNVTAVFNMCKAAIGELKKSEKATIVNISSDLGVKPIAERIAYCPSKAAVLMLTRCIALEHAPYVRANCIMPGLVETPMVKSRFDNEADLKAFRETMASIYPLKRLGTLDDMTNALLFLACDDSSYMTGESLGVCGGSLA